MEALDDINKQYSEKETELLQINNNRINILKSQLVGKEQELGSTREQLVQYYSH